MPLSPKLRENDLASLLLFEPSLQDLEYRKISASVPIELTGYDDQSSDYVIFRLGAVVLEQGHSPAISCQ